MFVGNILYVLKGTIEIPQDFLLRQLPHPTAVLNTRLEFQTASDSWFDFFGLLRRDVAGKPILEIFPESSPEWRQALQDCLRGKPEVSGSRHFIHPDQKESWFKWVCSPFFDTDENPAGIILQISDVTEGVKQEINQEKVRLMLEAQSENARIGSWWYEQHSGMLECSAMTQKILGAGEAGITNMEQLFLYFPGGFSRNTFSMAVFQAMESGRPWNEQLELLTPCGKELQIIATGRPIIKNGRQVGLLGTFLDITEWHRSNQKMRESEALLRTVVDNLPLNVYIKDLDFRKILVNKQECRFMGVSHPDELLGKDDFELYPEEMARTLQQEDLYVMDNQKTILGKESLLTKKDGSQTYFLTSKIPLYNEEQEVYGLMGISMDISELKDKETELRNLIEVTSQQNKKLINFAHIVSHNLRSHSANFSMLLEFLNQEQGEMEKRQILGMLTQASDNLLETLDNLNQVVAINTQVHLEKSAVPLRKAVQAVVKKHQATLARNQATVFTEIPKDLTVRVVPEYFDNILANLLSNALKYRHPDRDPEISLGVEKVRGYTVLSVADNGLGIDLKKNGAKLFGMYKTFHEHPEARGIGLFICKNQIEAMGGNIKAHSQVGTGTNFKIYINDRD